MLSWKFKMNEIAIGYALTLLAVFGCFCLLMTASTVPAENNTLQPPEMTQIFGHDPTKNEYSLQQETISEFKMEAVSSVNF